MTEEQRKSKFNLMKILSLVCLVVIIVSGFLPWVTLDGDYKDGVLGELSEITGQVTDEEIDMMQEALDEQDIDFNIEDFVDTIENMFDPITDGDISPMDFLALQTNFNAVIDYMDKASEIEEFGVTEMDAETEEMIEIVSVVIITPVAVFGVLAFAALVRLILRLFNRRGLGVFVSILSAFNALFMAGIAVILDMLLSETGDASASLTPVPLVVFVCSILGCIFWGQARKLIDPVVVKEVVEVPVEQDVPVQAEETVEENVEE